MKAEVGTKLTVLTLLLAVSEAFHKVSAVHVHVVPLAKAFMPNLGFSPRTGRYSPRIRTIYFAAVPGDSGLEVFPEQSCVICAVFRYLGCNGLDLMFRDSEL